LTPQDTEETTEEKEVTSETKDEEGKEPSQSAKTEPTEEETIEPEESEPDESEPDESEPEESEPEESEPDESTEPIGEGGSDSTVFTLKTDKNLCGYIEKDSSILTRTVFVGDSVADKQIKGYLSFKIDDLLDSPVLYARLRITGIVKGGDPTFADRFDIKVFDYGDSLDYADFAVGGDSLISVSTAGLTEIDVSGETLINLVQKTIDAGKSNFQLKMGLSSASYSDGSADLFAINPDSVVLTVEQ